MSSCEPFEISTEPRLYLGIKSLIDNSSCCMYKRNDYAL